MNRTTHITTTGAWRLRLIEMFALGILALALTGCAAFTPYTEADIGEFWAEVSAQYPGCEAMPRVTVVDNTFTGGYYVVNEHRIVIDKHASASVWRHEMRHACKDLLDETPIVLHKSGSIYTAQHSN